MARVIEFEGRRIEVPDDASDEEIRQIITQQPAAPPTPEQHGPDRMTDATYVLQRGNRGLAHAIGTPVDLATAGINVGLWGADKLAQLFGGSVDTRIEKPFMGSEWIADNVGDVYESAGGTIVQPEDVSGPARVAGTAAEFAGTALPVGMGLASGPVQAITQAGRGGNLLRGLASPYASSPGATLTRDAMAGAGAGIGVEGYENFAPEAVQESMAGPFLEAAAALAGGIGGVSLTGALEGVARGAHKGLRNITVGSGDPNAPVNPQTGRPYTRSEMDLAARLTQNQATNRHQAAANIDEAARDFRQFARPEEIPTTGMLADDIGLALGENVARTKNAQRFIERDHARMAAASDRIEQARPRNADPQAFVDTATRQYDESLGSARQAVGEAEARRQAFRDDIVRQNVELETYRARQPQVSEAMAEDFDSARRAAREAKNIRYDQVDPKTPVRGDFLKRAVDEIDARMPEAERLAGGPYSEIAGRVRRLVEQVDPETGEVSTRDITYGDLKALRAQVSEARKNAIAASGQSVAGSGADVERLDQLGAILGRMADEINPEAARFYREEYAPRFKEGRAGEYGAAIDRSARTGGESSATRPSQFGERFLRHPEDAASLRRAMRPLPSDRAQIEGPVSRTRMSGVDQATEQNVKEWMLGDLAKSGVLTDNAEIRYDRFKRWADRNRETINQFPELAKVVDDELAKAQRGGALSRQLADEVSAAKENLRMTERDLRLSALHNTIGAEPVEAVGSIMGGKGSTRKMEELVSRFKNDRQATAGLKDATIEWLKQEAGLRRGVTGHPEASFISRDKLEKLFQRHDETLSKLFSPEEMNYLQQARKFVKHAETLDLKATAGPNTFDKFMAASKDTVQQRMRMLEGALKARFGVLKGGGIYRTIRIFLETLPDGTGNIEDILLEMQFNPELAQHLLTRPVKDIGSPGWNKQLNRLMATAVGARDSLEGGDGSGEPLELTVTEPANADELRR